MQYLTLRQRAYFQLREKLATGQLASGMQLSEPDLAKELGMSRTPIREAIRQLEMERLLDYAPRFGAMVRVPQREELDEMCKVREALESYAAAEAARRITPDELQRLDQLRQQMQHIETRFHDGDEKTLEGDPLLEYLAADLEFHKVIIDAAGNRYMSKIIEDTRLLVRVFTATFWHYDERKLAEANRFHTRLFNAIEQRDGEAAQSISIEAVQVSRENALKAWDSHQYGLNSE